MANIVRNSNFLLKFILLSALLIFIGSPTKSIAQDNLVAKKINWRLSIEKNQENLNQLKDSVESHCSKDILGDFYHDLAVHWYHKNWNNSNSKKDIDKAIEFTKKAITEKTQIDSINPYSIKRSKYNLGVFQFKAQEFFTSIQTHLEILDFDSIDKKTLDTHLFLGDSFRFIGNYEDAIFHLDSFINLTLKNGFSEQNLIPAYINLAMLYSDMGYLEYEDKIKACIESSESLINQETPIYFIFWIKQLSANLALMLGNYQEAHDTFNELISRKGDIKPFYTELEFNENIGVFYNNLGVSLDKLGDSAKAIQKINKAKVLNKRITLPFENLGDLYMKRGLFEKGLLNYQKAVYHSIYKKNTPSLEQIPNVEELELSIEKKNLLRYLSAKANAWLNYFKHDGNTAHLTHALTTFERADELIDIIRSQSTEYQSKLYWRGQSAKLYMKAVEVSFLLNRPDKAYYFMERNKALLLLEDITHEKAKELSQLPDSIAKREFELKRAIHLAENTLQNNSSASPDSLQNFKNDIFQHKRSYEKFLDSLTTAFPDYARLKQQFQVLPYQDFKSYFSSEQTVTLQFILNDEQGYALLHANGKPQFYELENAESLNKNLLAFYANLSKFDKDLDSAKKVSNTIFKTLLPETAFESIKNKELIIVPDYNLQKIPFEALVSDTAHQRYLLEDVELRYAYSLSYLEAKKQVQTQAEEDLLALAPVDFENLGLAKLGFSGLEVDALKSIFGGETWLNEKASKENLLKNLDKHGILHFATHADIDENGNHWVAFSDDKLYLNEIYATRNQAEMVVLSACNTSRGELKNGEGVMSLARAFFNSGAKSVVSSLWPTVDKTSKDIMVDFYSGLDEGLPKATALRNAKLTYLQNNPGASPAQWAALIVIGDNRPVRHPNFFDNNWHWMALAGGLLVVPVFLWKRSRKQAA